MRCSIKGFIAFCFIAFHVVALAVLAVGSLTLASTRGTRLCGDIAASCTRYFWPARRDTPQLAVSSLERTALHESPPR